MTISRPRIPIEGEIPELFRTMQLMVSTTIATATLRQRLDLFAYVSQALRIPITPIFGSFEHGTNTRRKKIVRCTRKRWSKDEAIRVRPYLTSP